MGSLRILEVGGLEKQHKLHIKKGFNVEDNKLNE